MSSKYTPHPATLVFCMVHIYIPMTPTNLSIGLCMLLTAGSYVLSEAMSPWQLATIIQDEVACLPHIQIQGEVEHSSNTLLWSQGWLPFGKLA